jgi:hypothetical protein
MCWFVRLTSIGKGGEGGKCFSAMGEILDDGRNFYDQMLLVQH